MHRQYQSRRLGGLATIAAVSAAFALGCNSPSDVDQPPSPLTLVVLAHVADAVGEPFGGVNLVIEVRADADTAVFTRTGRHTDEGGSGVLVVQPPGNPVPADFTGLLTFKVENEPQDEVCKAFDYSAVTQSYHRPSGKAEDTLQVGVVAHARPRPILAAGNLCAIGSAGQGFVYLDLRVDSLRDTVFGAWAVAFSASIGSHYGTFAGPVHADSAILTLDDTTSPLLPPWTLRLPLDASLTTGSAELTRYDGYVYPGLFRLQPGW